MTNSELRQTSIVEHHISTGDHNPVRQQPRRVTFSLRDKVKELVDEMLEQGIITPSSSPWINSIVLVAKKVGSIRFCADYSKLNTVTKLDVFRYHKLMSRWISSVVQSTSRHWILPLGIGRWEWQLTRWRKLHLPPIMACMSSSRCL